MSKCYGHGWTGGQTDGQTDKHMDKNTMEKRSICTNCLSTAAQKTSFWIWNILRPTRLDLRMMKFDNLASWSVQFQWIGLYNTNARGSKLIGHVLYMLSRQAGRRFVYSLVHVQYIILVHVQFSICPGLLFCFLLAYGSISRTYISPDFEKGKR